MEACGVTPISYGTVLPRFSIFLVLAELRCVNFGACAPRAGRQTSPWRLRVEQPCVVWEILASERPASSKVTALCTLRHSLAQLTFF